MSLNVVNVAWACLGAVLELIVIAAAFIVGRHYGYWERVEIEKGARGL